MDLAPKAKWSIAFLAALAACSTSPDPLPGPGASTATITLETGEGGEAGTSGSGGGRTGGGTTAERRWRHTATLLADGSVLVAGGIQSDGDPREPSPSAALYVAGQLDVVQLPHLTTPRYGHTATRLPDGTVLLAGGFDERGEPLSAAELFLPDSQTFEPVARMITARGNHFATLLANGKVLIVDAVGVEVEAYDPAERAFIPLPARSAGQRQAAVSLSDGSVSFFGSQPGEQEVFLPSTNRFSPPETSMLLPTDLGTITAAVRLRDDRVGIFGTQSFVLMEPGEPCSAGQAFCDGQCAEVTTDPTNCGACGRKCGATQVCVEGQCACSPYDEACSEEEIFCLGDAYCTASCTDLNPSFTRCGDQCANLDTDTAHCGACNNACAVNEGCAAGRCVCTREMCGGACIDVYYDSNHCGTCDNGCGGRACWNGQCRDCPQGYTHCGARCVILSSDPKNCGACGTECTEGTRCESGVCGGRCAADQMLCEGSCLTTSADPQNCSTCGLVCNPNSTCWASACVPRGSTSQAEPPPLGTTLVGDGVWLTSNSAAYEIQQGDWTARRLQDQPPPSSFEFGGPGHTATALPDGSLLMVGGSDTNGITRRYPVWQRVFGVIRGGLADPTSVLLPDGRTLCVGSEVFAGFPPDAHHVTLASVGMAPRAAAVQPTGEVLVVGTSEEGGAAARLVATDLTTVTTPDVPLSIAASGLALPGGIIVTAGADGLEVVRPARRDSGFELDRVDAELDCARPTLARLPNGHALVLGSLVAYELDVVSLELSDPVTLKQPRCRAGIVVRPGGALIVGGARGTNGEGAASITVEAYDIEARTTEVQNLIGTSLLDATTIPWFDGPLLFGAFGPNVRLNIEREAFETIEGPGLASPRLLADGTLFGFSAGAEMVRLGLGSWASRDSFGTAVSVRMNTDVDFGEVFAGAEFPGNAPEGSTGTTQSSPSNVPIPVWFPAEGGWPLVGTLKKVGTSDVYHVPRTPFPGLGLIFLSTNGTLTGYGPVVIESSNDGTECHDAGECASGFCVDGFCCDEACGGKCVACSNAAKGRGEDGVCEPVTAGTTDDQCEDDGLLSCEHDGTCDGRGECAFYPDGTECAEGFECSNHRCDPKPGPGPTGDGGAPNTDATCNGEAALELNGRLIRECDPYRCPLGSDQCLESCDSNRDCVGGYACTAAGKCEKALSVTRLEGCGCRLESRGGQGPSPWILGLSALFGLGRRFRRRRALAARLG